MLALSPATVFLAQALGAIVDPIALVVMLAAGLVSPRWWGVLIPAAGLAGLNVMLRGEAGEGWAVGLMLAAWLSCSAFGLLVWAIRWRLRKGPPSVAP